MAGPVLHKNAGGIPRLLTALHKGTQSIYTMVAMRTVVYSTLFFSASF